MGGEEEEKEGERSEKRKELRMRKIESAGERERQEGREKGGGVKKEDGGC